MAHATGGDDRRGFSQHARLDAIPDDLHYLIAYELKKSSPLALLALGQTSRVLRQAVLPLVYRELILLTRGSENSKAEKAYDAIIEILRDDKTHAIAKYVRSITVKSDLPEEDFILILDQIAKHGTLRRLSWETLTHMTESVFNKLHATWPELELSVRVLHRRDARIVEHRQMDVRLLSSPLLKSLTYFVYYAGQDPVRTEWPQLTQALATGGNLRVLRIKNKRDGDTHQSGRIFRSAAYKEPIPFDFAQQAKLPALGEFTLAEERFWSGQYRWDQEHREMLRTAFDWSKLRKLDFGSKMPVSFFKNMTGTLPHLKSLRFGVRNGPVEVVNEFLESVDALESLDIDEAQKGIDILWPGITKQKSSLKELIMRPATAIYTQPECIEISKLEIIVEQFTSLECLGWDVPCDTHPEPRWFELFGNRNLRSLDVFLLLPSTACEFSAEMRQDVMGEIPPPPLDQEKAKRAAFEMMEIVSQGHREPLRRLTLHFTRKGYYDRFQPYLMYGDVQVRRTGTESAVEEKRYEFGGKQEWSQSQGSDEQLMFEE